MLYAYDLETRELIGSKPIAIWKGTPTLDAYNDKKIAGDKKTPVWYYMVVQKKDPKRIRDTIEDELYDEYGGDDGWMLVLAGSWQPQIAIHGTKKETVWTVSSGCVRMDNASIRQMMDSVLLWSMVIITN
jgi:lipoprotein-anchoring transpeptidase ErfK/SrfK